MDRGGNGPRQPQAFNAYVVPIASAESKSSVEPNDYLVIVGNHWKAVSIWSLVGFLFALLLSFGMERNYRAEVVVLPVQDSSLDGVAAKVGSQLGGLGELIGSNVSTGNTAQYIAQLKSRALMQRFITSHGLEPLLIRPRGLARFIPQFRSSEPSLARAVKRFQEDVRLITEDHRSGVITLAIEGPDRQVATDWANDFIKLANDSIRERTIQDSQRTLDYLGQTIEKTSLLDLRQSLFRVVESQQRTLAMAETRPEYAFRLIDPATTPDRNDRVGPRRPVVALFGLVAFMFASSAYFIARHHLARA
jgi:uncharacterized protein involved in exopolysaccharide biosynthesis